MAESNVWRVLTAAILVLIALLLGPSSLVNRLPVKPVPADRGGLPEYLTGDRIVAGKRTTFTEIDKNRVSFTWTPATLTANMYTTCDHSIAGTTVHVYLQINGQHFEGGSCDGTGAEEGFRSPLDEKKLRMAEVQAGRPVKVVIGVLPVEGLVPDSGTVTAGIGEPVAWDAFPFPERPGRLASLNRERYENTVGAMLQDARGTHSFTLDGNTNYTVYAQSQTPGQLHLRWNDRSVKTLEWWDYKAHTMRYQIGFTPGTPSTLTVVPEHLTGDWIVVAVPVGIQ